MRGNLPAVLVIRTDGIGDAVLAEPMLASLSRRFGTFQLHLWAPAATCELLRACPFVGRRLVVPRGFKAGNLAYFHSIRWRVKLGYHLGRWAFDTAAYLVESPEPLGNWLLASARAKARWYNPGDAQNQFPAQRAKAAVAATAVVNPRGEGHELSRNAHAARQWGDRIEGRIPVIHAGAAARAAADTAIASWRDAARRLGASAVIGLMPGSSMAVKGYPTGAWERVVTLLWRERRAVCALIGSPQDAAEAGRLCSLLRDAPYARFQTAMDLPTTAAFLGALDGFISVDTGLAHLALAQDVPTVVLCGGGHPGRFFPWPVARRSITLNHPMPCAGCLCRCHLAEAECLTKIVPEDVVGAMSELLDGRVRLPIRAAG